tara:strand:- start:39 stop:257 length:219 start_codon:yes stop_codon:yes gene_type:complete
LWKRHALPAAATATIAAMTRNWSDTPITNGLRVTVTGYLGTMNQLFDAVGILTIVEAISVALLARHKSLRRQ